MAVPAAALVAGRAATSSRRSIGVTLTALLSLVVAVLGPLVAVVVLAALGVASTVGANAAGAWGLPIQPGEFLRPGLHSMNAPIAASPTGSG